MKILSSKFVLAAAGASAILLAARAVFAIDVNQLTFPIAELGNCATTVECKTYCGQSANYPACKAFAASHQVKPPTDTDKTELVDEAKNFLGCTSYDTCKAFCQQTENRQKCQEFSVNRSQAPVTPAIVTLFFGATQQELGCNSVESCKATCDQPTNFQRCTQFAKRHNLFRPKPLPTTNSLNATPSSKLMRPDQ
ncbi:hypothetical protein HY440_02660 [Candidatus Microgenomates bacterium]|nr:hypothetical protein [Candidatus Microgenomates bacterium]